MQKVLKMGSSILSSQWFINTQFTAITIQNKLRNVTSLYRTFTDLNLRNLSAFESANVQSKLISESVGQNLLTIFDNLQTDDERYVVKII
jgi:hypothetical protein